MLTKIAAIQMASGPQVKSNLMVASQLIRDAVKNGAQLIVLPESFALMAIEEVENISIAENQGDGVIQNTIKQLAIDNKVWIAAGSIPLKTNSPDKVSSASLMFNDKGEIVARYNNCLLYTSPSPRDKRQSRMPSSA